MSVSNTSSLFIAVAAFVVGAGSSGAIVSNHVQSSCDHASYVADGAAIKKLAQTATDNFVLGACGGTLRGCNKLIQVATNDPNDTVYTKPIFDTYYIALGNVYKDNPALHDKPYPVQLPKACTGISAGVYDHSTDCVVISPGDVIVTDTGSLHHN